MLDDEIIQSKAAELRARLGIDRVLAPCLYAVIEKLKTVAPRFNFRVALASELGNFEAIMDDEHHMLIVRDSVIEDVKAGKTRARFTIAHELGHYFLGRKGQRQRNTIKAIYATARDRMDEQEADIFASNFLVPTELALSMTTSEEIADRFQVSSIELGLGAATPLPSPLREKVAERSEVG